MCYSEEEGKEQLISSRTDEVDHEEEKDKVNENYGLATSKSKKQNEDVWVKKFREEAEDDGNYKKMMNYI